MRKKSKIYAACSIILAMVMLMSGCFVANQAKENRFYKDAKDHIKDKYGLETKSLLFYAKPDRSCSDINGLGRIKYTGAEFGLLELSNGEHVVVSYVDGNYADGYEYYDLYTAWLSKLSDEIGEEVTAVGLVSDDIETYGNTVTEKRIGTFIEKSTVRYNASNVDAFEDAYYSYMQPTEIQMDIYKEDPTEEWIDEVAERLNQYRKNHGVDLLTVEVRSEKPTYEQRIDAADFSNRRIDGGGEYQIWNNYVDRYKNLFFTITIRFGSVTYERENAYFRRLNEED